MITTDSLTRKELVLGKLTPQEAIASGKVEISGGDPGSFISFMDLFEGWKDDAFGLGPDHQRLGSPQDHRSGLQRSVEPTVEPVLTNTCVVQKGRVAK